MKFEAESMANTFKAFSDPTRLKMIHLLAFNQEFCKKKNLCVADLAKLLGITQPAVSQHLKVLKGIGIITQKRDGLRRYYRIERDALTSLRGNIDGFLEMNFNDGKGNRTLHNPKNRKRISISRIIKDGNAEIREFSYPSGAYAYSIRTEVDEDGNFITRVIGNPG